MSSTAERGSSLAALPSLQPADVPPGVLLVLPAVGAVAAHGLRLAATLSLFTTPWFYLPSKLHAYLSGLNNLGVQIILRFSLQALQTPYLELFSPMEWVNPWSPTCCTASWKRWITCIGWATSTGQWTRSTWFLLMFVNVSMSRCCPVSGVKASHILLSEEGRVYLSGLHSVYSMMRDGKRMRAVFDMPHHSPALLPWLSPELLRQVRTHPGKIFTLL